MLKMRDIRKRGFDSLIRKQGYEALPKRMGSQAYFMMTSYGCCINCCRMARCPKNWKRKGKRQADLRRGACRIKRNANLTPETPPRTPDP